MPIDRHPGRTDPVYGMPPAPADEPPAPAEQELPAWLQDMIEQSNREVELRREVQLEQSDSSSRKGVGRPAMGDAKRTYRVGISLSADEMEAWRYLAEVDGIGSVARWARERVMSSLALRELGHSELGGEVAGLRADLGRVGNNLNQIARAVNVAERGGPEGPSTAELLSAIDATRAELAEIRAWTRRAS
ncbi:plasmid mobilization relaxosome protein MobC [Brachybacterium alimentarium]|uniref:plasmid mobilization relaxosome protein MobC n=1 Tax=Brachybacterium alimentarium TaxID=47845 RepID=UPI003FD3E6E8